MSLYFEELDWRPTPIGTLSLRRRRELSLGLDVHEIKLGDEFLMSSLFTESEVALARLAGVFAQARAEPVTFHNPLQDRPFTQTVYLARK